MISPSYSITATERVLPMLALDFTTATLDPRVTFTRTGNTATVTNSSGVIVSINADLPRFDYNPTTLICNGLLIEESRTNVLLNSLIDGTVLGTQVVVVTAAARTLSFYGTGQIVLSGAASATVTGTGAYPTRTTLTFTPSAGVLTLTVTGTVQFAQLELGSFATSFIPTAASQVTRTADVATMTGTNFSNWFNASEGTFAAEFASYDSTTGRQCCAISADDGGTDRIQIGRTVTNACSRAIVLDNASTQANISSATSSFALNTFGTCTLAYKANSFFSGFNATALTPDTSGTVPTVNQLGIGNGAGVNTLNGHVANVYYWPQRLTNAEAQSFSK